MGFSVALKVEPPWADRIVEFSEYLASLAPTDVLLGMNSEPHVTVLKTTAEAPYSASDMDITPIKDTEVELEFRGLNIVPSRSTPRTWVEVSVLSGMEMRSIHEWVRDHLSIDANYLECEVGERWRPHITVARFLDRTPDHLEIPRTLLRAKGVRATLAVGTAGDTFLAS